MQEAALKYPILSNPVLFQASMAITMYIMASLSCHRGYNIPDGYYIFVFISSNDSKENKKKKIEKVRKAIQQREQLLRKLYMNVLWRTVFKASTDIAL